MKVVVFIVSAFWIVMPLWAQQQVVADPPEVRGPLTLAATYESAVGHNAFAYNGDTVPPVIRVLRKASSDCTMSIICQSNPMRCAQLAAAPI